MVYPSGCLDAWRDPENDVIHREAAAPMGAQSNQRRQPAARIGIEFEKPVMGKYPVFAGNRHDIRSDANGYQVEVLVAIVDVHVIFLDKRLHEFEPDTASR